jgi:methylsterol monooxygenase/4-alpha-methyl-delta7-sterol-4alpha-methyl oxidase
MTSTEGHSGYEIPWTPFRVIPLISGPSFHDHHHSSNVGNYAGSCYFWDLMLDTSLPYFNEYLR